MIFLIGTKIELNILKLKCATVGHVENFKKLHNWGIHIISEFSDQLHPGIDPCKYSLRIHNFITV